LFRRSPALAVAATIFLLACGGDDRGDVRRTVRDFVRATDQRDAEAFCGDLVTEEYLEQTTGARGERAEATCRQQLRAITGLRLRLVRVRNAQIDGDRARATVVLETHGRRQVRVFRLDKEDGDWRVAGGRER
jgi:Domain of unknown function (DUF4878)